jgi:hypothetical protein
VFLSTDFLVALPVGVAFGAVPALVDDLAQARTVVPVLLAMVGVLTAVAAIVLAAHTLVVTLMSPEYTEVISRTPEGLQGLSAPYLVVMRVAIFGLATSLSAALVWPALAAGPSWLRWLVFALPSFLTLWSLIGCGQLVGLGAFHLEQRSALRNVLSEVRRLRRSA